MRHLLMYKKMILLKRRVICAANAILCSLALVACGGGGGGSSAPKYVVGGTVAGLDASGATVELRNNGGNALTVGSNGSFAFPTSLPSGTTYNVTVSRQPSATTVCVIANGSGTVTSAAVTSVEVSCGAAHYAYAVDSLHQNIWQFVYGPDGVLTPQITPEVSGGFRPTIIMRNLVAPYVYVMHGQGGDVSQHAIGSDGALAPLVDAIVLRGGVGSMAIEPTGRYAYATSLLESSIFQYLIGASGNFTPMSVPSVATGPVNTVNAVGHIVVDPSGRNVYALTNDGVLQYPIGLDGGLLPSTSKTVFPSGLSTPTGIVAAPHNAVYVLFESGVIAQYASGANGALTPMAIPNVITARSPSMMAIDPTGRYMYVSGGAISQYVIGADGALTPMTPATLQESAGEITVDATGRFVYVPSSNSISLYAIGAGGSLTRVASLAIGVPGTNSFTSIVTK